ncbi:MAG: hypothetical protein II997_04475 [Clostridia bacterium]|nr:hypothetical protein [Clostridia bacterium]
MKCNHCEAELGYGYKYCTKCGENVSKTAVEDAYNETAWGKFDALIAKYEGCKLKRITGNYLFRVLLIVICVALLYFGFWGDTYRLRIVESDIYRIQYDTKTEEYYVLSDAESFELGIHIPKFSDNVRFTCYAGEESTTDNMKPAECRIPVVKGKYDYMTVEAMRGKKVIQLLKFSAH